VICASTPEPFVAVGQAYRNFEQTTDEEVRDLLHAAGPAGAARDEPPTAGPTGVGPGIGGGTPARGPRLLPLTPATSMALPGRHRPPGRRPSATVAPVSA
jgi:hypothetical protein